MNTSTVLPDEYSATCAICMDDLKEIIKHPCPVCVKDAWVVCSECNDKISICPICRTSINPINPNIIVNINIHNLNSDTPPSNNRGSRNTNTPLKNLWYFMKLPGFFILFVYIGKIYVYAYCTGTCDPKTQYVIEDGVKTDTCTCDSFAHRDNYWGDFHYCIGEALLAIIVSGIIFACCCIKDY
jgi:hypothetical protein